MRGIRILLASLGSQLAVLGIITLVTTGYAFRLAFQVRGAPDQSRIAQFASHLGGSTGDLLQVLVTAAVAAWALRRVADRQRQDGALIGLLVALVGFAMSPRISSRAVTVFLLTVGAGWFGGALVARRQSSQEPRR